MLDTSIEQRDMAVHYNYYKVLQIAVIFLPQQSSYVDTTFKFQVNWTQSTELNNINFEDNTKEIAKYRVRQKCFTFVPPDISYLVGDTTSDPVELTVINPYKYIKTYFEPNKYFPGCLAINENGANAMPVRVIFRIEYRGSKIPTAAELNGVYSTQLKLCSESSIITKGEVTNKALGFEQSPKDTNSLIDTEGDGVADN
jgi:hypothetical protein